MTNEEHDAYDAFGNSIDNWIDDAACLFGCAKLLLKHSVMFGAGITPPFPMKENHLIRGAALLRAFSVECLLKALWLKQRHRLAEAGRYVAVPGVDQHDLVALAGKTEFPLSEDEREFLKRLTLWGFAGRYPIEKRFNEDASFHHWNDGYERTFEALVRRLLEATAPREGPPA